MIEKHIRHTMLLAFIIGKDNPDKTIHDKAEALEKILQNCLYEIATDICPELVKE